MASRIEDYALIGDCRSAALVSRDGSIDWLCWPRFDSAACFAALLGSDDHGCWRIAPDGAAKTAAHRYRGDTLIVETLFETATGRVTLIDFLAIDAPEPTLVRLVRGEAGEVAMRSDLTIRFDYGLTIPWVSRGPNDELVAVAGPSKLVLRTPVRLVGQDMATQATFTVPAGETVPFVLQHAESFVQHPAPCDAAAALAQTERFWRDWADRCLPGNPWHDAVKRSLLTLKGLTFHATGGIVAAPTTSLPEKIGGVRNWDYRICWLRDSSFTLQSLMIAGYREEALAWRDWLVRAVAGSPDQTQIMYGIAGERLLDEREIPWLPGYENSAPVRIGNAAAEQRQLDVFGEVLDALYHSHTRQDAEEREHARVNARPIGRILLERLETIWREPDEGIWEVRGPPRHFVHSKIMAWVAFDRAVRAVEETGADAPVERWIAQRDEIHADVCAKGFDPEVGAFMQYYGADTLDASVLLAPMVGFLPADDPRMIGTVKAIEKRLLRDGFIMRYEQPDASVDGLPPGEGAFLACSFWYIDVLADAGPHRRGEGDVRAADRPRERRGAALRGIRPGCETDARQFSASLQPCRADQFGVHAGAGDDRKSPARIDDARRSARARVGHAPDHAIAVLAEQERAVGRDRHGHRATENGLVVEHEAGDEILVNAGRRAIRETQAHDLVTGALAAIPRSMQRDEGVAAIVGRKAVAFVEGDAERRRMGLDQHVRHPHLVREIGTQAGAFVGMRADVKPWPAVERAVADLRRIIGRQIVAQHVPLVDRAPQPVGCWRERHGDAIAQAGRQDAAVFPLRIEDQNGRAKILAAPGRAGRARLLEGRETGWPPAHVLGDIGLRTDRDEHPGSVAGKNDIARRMSAIRQTAYDRLRLSGRDEVAGFVRKPDDRCRAGDIKPFRVRTGRIESEPERAVDAGGKSFPLDDRRSVGRETQRRDRAVRALRHEQIAVRREAKGSRAADAGRERRDGEAGRNLREDIGRFRHDADMG